MATYRCLADLQGKILHYDDIVIIKSIHYTVRKKFLRESNGKSNDIIFDVLSIPSKIEFTTNAYGYNCAGGNWPECKPHDYEALTRCVIELYKIAEGKTSITSKKKWYKITTPGATGISQEKVKELIVKYGGKLDPDFDYKSKLGAYVWTENERVICINKGDVRDETIEVSSTTEIITTKKEEKYENQFQRKKARIERGTRPEGSTVCGRRGKASVAVGHLGYRKVTGI